MSYIVVYFSTGEVIDFTDVVNRRRVWRRVSKACKRWGSRVDRVIEIRNCTRADLNALYGYIALHGYIEMHGMGVISK